MKISSFKSVLLRKIDKDSSLAEMLRLANDDYIINKVIESLQKMPRPQTNAGKNANSAITTFASRLTNKDIEMIRDCLAHHVSKHKAELSAGNRVAADQHLNKIVPLMHLVSKMRPHSNGKIDMDFVHLEPWESNYTTLERLPRTGKLKEGTKNLGRRLSNTDRSRNPRGVPDYRYLEMPPHAGHPDMKHSQHKNMGYPFEEIQVGSPENIDSKRAYLPIKNMQATGKFDPHPFDSHPIHKLADIEQGSLNEQMQASFAKQLDDWINHDANAQWLENMRKDHIANPEEFKARGLKKPEHHFSNIDLLEQPEHARNYVEQTTDKPLSTEPKPEFNESMLPSLPKDLQEKFAQRMAQRKSTTATSEDDDIIAAYEAAAPQDKPKLWSKYRAAMDKRHGGGENA